LAQDVIAKEKVAEAAFAAERVYQEALAQKAFGQGYLARLNPYRWARPSNGAKGVSARPSGAGISSSLGSAGAWMVLTD